MVELIGSCGGIATDTFTMRLLARASVEDMRKITDLLLAELTNPTDKARGKMQNTRPSHRRR